MNEATTLYHGDMREILPTLPAGLATTVLTDPPYEIGMMGKGWDRSGVAFQPSTWEAVSRACKPGAFLFAFGSPRTYHRLACAIEDGGWEIRDCIMWLFGSGWPKSLDVGKAIDRSAGVEREVIGTGRAGASSLERVRRVKQGYRDTLTSCTPESYAITAPATLEAKLWDGWGTALKPAYEPIVVAMKPLDGTFAENALKHGVAGLNIAGSRVGLTRDVPASLSRQKTKNVYGDIGGGHPGELDPGHGRWPANVVLDEEAAAALDAQSGVLKSGRSARGGHRRHSPKHGTVYEAWDGEGNEGEVLYGDAGGASRFYYCPKASKRERGEYNSHPAVKPLALLTWLVNLSRTPTGGVVLDPFLGSGSTALACLVAGRACVGIELDAGYLDIARRRIAGHQASAPRQQGLFDD